MNLHPSIIDEFDRIEELKSVTDTLKNIRFPTTELIIVGSFIFVVSFYGCYGVVTKNTLCLKLYAVFCLMIIGGVAVIAAIGYYQYKDITTKDVEKLIADNFNKEKYNSTKSIIDLVQSTLGCCGNSDKDDYSNTENFPLSCCPKENSKTCYNDAYKTGCSNITKTKASDALNEIVYKVKKLFLPIAISVGIIELISMLFALNLAHYIKHKLENYSV
ncbi:23 kDa integral membrane protein-like [Aphidius gifuensis]|uniref:23 kDa integral membrane protein-like n=1 Tax=Aphidius gifuensis TaxID=684658 RepID=UPI001CDBA7D0|nr:23 kDa integral membrane protein-like [Aphidius gifuensis]